MTGPEKEGSVNAGFDHRALFDRHPECIKILAADGSLLDMNAAGLRLLGAESLEQVRQRGIHTFVADEDRAAFRALITRVFGGESGVLEFRVTTLAGEQRWLETHATPLRDSGGAVTALLGITRDITDRKRADAVLRESERRNRLLADLISDYAYIFRVTTDGTLVGEWVTESFTRTFGLSLADVQAAGGWQTLVVPEDLPLARAHVRKVLAGDSDVCEMRWRTANGDIRVLRDYARPEFDESGTRIVRVIGASQDMTERVRVETALRESEERFRLLVDHAPEAVVLLDVETGRFVHANPAAERLFKLSATELMGVGPVDLSPPVQPDGQPSAAKAQALVASAVAGDRPVFEWTHRDAEGRDIPCEVRLLRMELGGRQIVRGSVLDISERKAAEQQIRKLARTYAVLSDVNQLIVRERDTGALLAGACRIAVETGGFRLAWIGLAEANGQLRVVAHGGATPDTLAVVRNLVEGDEPDCAFTYHALRRGEPAVCHDIATDERARTWRAEALARDYRSMASLPLRVGERTVGTFNLYAAATGSFDPDELRLLDEMASDIGFALETWELERERQRAERTLQELMRTVDGIVWEADANTFQFSFVSSHAERLLGYPAERWVTEPGFWADHIHPDDREQTVAFCVNATREKRDHQFEYRMLAADGRAVWLRDFVTVVVENGQPARLRGIMVDITAFKEAEAALHASEARFREIAEAIEDVFWITDRDKGRMLYVSPAYERIWGRPVSELYASAQAWLDSVHPDDRPRVMEAIPRQAAGQFDVEYRIIRPDGQERWIRDVAYPVRDETGNVMRIAGVARDITDRHLAQAQQRRLEEQLRQVQKMEAVGQLAGGVAHDFNNILAAIIMQTGLLTMEEDRLPADVSAGLREIAAAAERAANLTRQLLLFGRRQVMQPRAVDLNDTVTNMAKMLQRIIGEDVQLQMHFSSTPLWTRADPGMLDQVLMNLAVNARDAMPEGGQLRIETMVRTVDEAAARQRSDVEPGLYVALRVQDTGSGIAPQHLDRIFEPFFTTKEPGKGTGLGLSTVFGIVKQHRGWIEVTSQPGRGTTFEVGLPALSLPAAASAPAVAGGDLPRGTETILLVEDDAAVRLATRTILERQGYRVIEAPDGSAAIERWEQHRATVDLLLTDIVMPGGMSGRALATQLQSTRPDLKVIYVTGYSAELAAGTTPMRAGEVLLQKPLQADALLATVRRTLDG